MDRIIGTSCDGGDTVVTVQGTTAIGVAVAGIDGLRVRRRADAVGEVNL